MLPQKYYSPTEIDSISQRFISHRIVTARNYNGSVFGLYKVATDMIELQPMKNEFVELDNIRAIDYNVPFPPEDISDDEIIENSAKPSTYKKIVEHNSAGRLQMRVPYVSLGTHTSTASNAPPLGATRASNFYDAEDFFNCLSGNHNCLSVSARSRT